MRDIEDANLVDIGFFHHGGGKRVLIDGVKYLRRPLLALDDVGTKSSADRREADLLFHGGGENLVVNNEGGRKIMKTWSIVAEVPEGGAGSADATQIVSG